MMSVTRPHARSAVVRAVVPTVLAALALALAAGLAGCDSGDDLGGDEPGSPASHGSDVPDVVTVTTLEKVGRTLDAEHRTRVKAAVTDVIDPWFDAAFLGTFPRTDWSPAFASFTRDAAGDAESRDLDLLTNAGISSQIESATATRRRVRLNVFAEGGHPRGATAHFVLEFKTAGDLETSLRLRGDLYLSKVKGDWKIFGYDVDQAEPL
jgi:hypothetical protein